MLTLIWGHWFADFICQTDKMAVNKSHSVKHLLAHCVTYTIMLYLIGWFILFLGAIFPILTPFVVSLSWKFCLINGTTHFIVDYFTSKWTAYLWARERRGVFFKVIGLDQAIHMTTLFLTYLYI